MATTAQRLREALDRIGMKQSELAEKTGIGKSSISTYLTGAYLPKQKNIYLMAKALDVNEAWLMGVDAPMERDKRTIPFSVPASNLVTLPPLRSVPLVGTIACGTPILAAENIEGSVFLPETINADYALRCKGDSMVGADILDGDIVYIRQDAEVVNGGIYAVMVGEGETAEATLKHVYQSADTLTLTADNPAYPPMVYAGAQMTKVTVIGKAVGFTRKI